jgi:cytochrome b
MERVLIWDLPVRIFHWLFAGSFVVAYATGDSESWRLVHVASGTLAAALVLYRLVWGFVGGRHARFRAFVRPPGEALRYLLALAGGQAPHHAGHNPAGGYAVLALLSLGLACFLTGWPLYNDIGGEMFEDPHEAVANLMLAVVGLHLAGVAVGSLVHRENLARSMVTGRKCALPSEASYRLHIPAALMLLGWAALALWISRLL